MRNLKILILFSLLSVSCLAVANHQQLVDSLKTQLEHSDDSLKIKILLQQVQGTGI